MVKFLALICRAKNTSHLQAMRVPSAWYFIKISAKPTSASFLFETVGLKPMIKNISDSHPNVFIGNKYFKISISTFYKDL